MLSFQSHLGLISTPNRLVSVSLNKNFQSHLGLISTGINVKCQKCGYTLSIPPWSDFNSSVMRSHGSQKSGLSIPPWSDFNRRYRLYLPSLRSLLSIPPWSDFNSTSNLCCSPLHSSFQSHLGLISTVAPRRSACRGYNPFNPTLV